MEGLDGLYGLDAEIAGKLLAKRDLEFEKDVMKWVVDVLGIPPFSSSDVLANLKSGVILCRLMNKLVPGTISTYNEEGKIRSPLQEVENVQIYLKGCWKIGVSDNFTVGDLKKLTGVGLVLNNICSLMRTAVSLGSWNGPTLGPIQTKENTTKKWNPVDTAPRFSHADDVEGLSEFDRMFSRMQLELVELQQERSRLLAQKLNLMEELRGLKETHDEERKKLQKKMSDMEAKLDGGKASGAAPPSWQLGSSKDLWQSASSETERASKLLEQVRFRREKEEEEATRAAARVANLAAEKAALIEQLEARKEENEKASIENNASLVGNEDKSSKIVVRAVANATGFYYTASQGTDPKKLEALQDKIRDLMLSRSVDFGVVALLAEEFGMEAGRRVFGVCLKMLLKQKRRVEMKNDSFELLLYLINRSLMSMNLSTASDFITGRVFLKSAHKIFRKLDDHKEDFVFNYIRDHPLWHSIEFWEENFWTEEVKRVRKTGANVGFAQAAVSNVYNAYTWSLSHPDATLVLLKRILAEEKPSSYESACEQLKVLIPEQKKRPTRPAPRIDERKEEERKPNRPPPRLQKAEEEAKKKKQEEERNKLLNDL